MKAKSAGILLYRLKRNLPEIFLVHPGGPYWKYKDLGAWSVPKGEFSDEEDGLTAARREFLEETGFSLDGPFTSLPVVTQKGGKMVYVWAAEGDIDPLMIRSNNFEMEWPPRSALMQSFPEVDRAAWFLPDEARKRLLPAQAELVDQLLIILGVPTV